MKWSHLIITVIAFALFTETDAARTGRIEIGKSFPDLSLPSADDGRPVSIASFRGEKVIVQVFASW